MQSHDKSFGGLGALLTDTPHAQTEPYTIYFAGGLFDHKELFGNAKLAEYIERVSRGKYVCVLPQDLEQTDNRAAEVRNQDLLQVMKNDLAIFNFDGTELDSGTVVEMVFGKMLDIPAVVLRTDFRNAGDGAKDGDPWNLMCSAYPRNKVLLVHSMAWYQEALRQGGTTAEVEERLYTRMATAVIEQLDAVIQQKGWLTDEVNVQEIYKAALLFPGSGLEKTPDSFLRSIIRRKTAHLFSGCAEIGGMLGTATPEQLTALREYGFNLGVAFQIVDDVLDYVADETALGKPIGADLREGKVTLPIILLLQRTGPDVAALIHGIVADGQITVEKWRTIKSLLAQHGAVDAAFARAVHHATLAKDHLRNAFAPSEERDRLISLADYLLSRDR